MTTTLIIGSAISGLIGVWIGNYFNEQRHRREIGVKMIEIALGLVSQKPDENKPLRDWAVVVLDKYAKEAEVPLTEEAKSALRDKPFPVIPITTTIFDAATGRYWRQPGSEMMGMPETLREAARKASDDKGS